jgi:hypothetical protein
VLISSCAAAFCCAPALAVVPPFRYEAALSEGLSEELQSHTGASFEQLWGITFDSSGNLLVADPTGRKGKSIVDKFNATGAFQAQLGAATLETTSFARSVAVNDETGHVYVGDGNKSEIFALSATGEKLSPWTGANTPANTFGEGCCFINVAVDDSTGVSKGDVYAAIAGIGGHESEVDVFKVKNGDKEEGEFVRKLNLPEKTHLGVNGGIAVNDANGEAYVVDEKEHGFVDRFSATGEFEASAQIKGPSAGSSFMRPIAVAVDGATGSVFVIDKQGTGAETIYEFSPVGELLNKIIETAPGEALGAPVALAVERAGPHAGDLYASDQAKKRIDVFAPLPPEAPAIVGEPVTEVSAEGASLGAEIDPRGAITQYRIEYGRCAAPSACGSSPYEHRTPEPDATLAGAEDFAVHSVPVVRVLGLSPEATYHLRVIAHNTNGQTSGEERIFTTQGPGGSLQLPDGREWELVSPPDKHAAVLSVPGEGGVIQAAANGDAITYLANAPTESAPQGYAGKGQVLSTRMASGWSSKDLATPHEAATGRSVGTAPEYRYFTEGLSAAIVQPFGLFNPALSNEASEQTPYLRTLGGCESNCYRPLVTGKAGFSNVPPGTHFGEEARCEENNGIIGGAETVCGPRFLGASGDGSRFVLMSVAPLVAGAPAGFFSTGHPLGSLYEWSAGHLELISILPPKGEELPAPIEEGPGGGPYLGSGFGLANGNARRAISADGSRVFWEAGGSLYVRDTTKKQTLQIDAAEAECLAKSKCESGAGRFQIASADGSRVYFTDVHRLTGNAGAAVKEPDLYECKIAEVAGRLACGLKDLTPIGAGKGANVQGDVLGASEDGAILYFVADGALAGSGTSERGTCVNEGETAQPVGSKCNLYELQNGQARFVTVLSGMDAKVWTQSTENQPRRVSPSGQWLAFMSARSLTGYDNRDAISGKPDAEVFLYDNAGSGSLVCASCNPSGARPRGAEYQALQASGALPVAEGEWESTGWVSALLPRTTAISLDEPGYQPRFLSDQGRLFFNSLDALVPQDVNGTGDVYEYEPAGIGSCVASVGCVGLISSGTSQEPSAFLDASSSGDDVFFLTSSKLNPQDKDTRMDVYDAHVCTSAVPCLARAAAEPPPCITEASCKPTPSVQPSIFGAPASATFSGPGNVIPEPVARARKAKPPTRARLLRRALAACRKHHPRSRRRRSACERQTRKKYAAKKASKRAKAGHR